ncbi:Acetyltransferase (GNAT) family protein [Actinacidiphila yanglinensis]|uniref:Acetyltransferase (GNAT) family protein n=1 Tax=Actinacidiphila yanglinensis TaxID=310779 RepID=A0A1H6DYU8_9ACTN|nr:GNAT family N-acetyltransferase [Actinacidiphila yanglinensis]SEG90164.1 Acetyltransferase (GNAT) family protein [Actinacidiphila yanglinensis]
MHDLRGGHPPPVPPLPPLPPPYRARPATPADAGAIHRLVADCEREVLGRAETGLDAVTAHLTLPALDPALDTLLVHRPGRERGAEPELVGRAWVHGGRRSEVDVHPAHRGRGLGRLLLDWAEERARSVGSVRLAQPAEDADAATVALLRSRGYEPFVTQWLLGIALPEEPEVPEPPAGVDVRPFRSGDEKAAHELFEDAFSLWQKRRLPYDEWARLTVERAAFAPEVSPVAFAGTEMVGAALAFDVPGSREGYVDRLAVRADHRGRGIAGVLLREVFRAFHRRGRTGCTLWTHSETGALSLYEHVGMTVRRSSSVYARALTPG